MFRLHRRWSGRFIRGSVAVFLAAAGLTAATLLTPGAAGAAPCNGTPVTNCTSTGTINMTGGTLTLTAPAGGLSWNALLNGLNQDIVDTDPSVQTGLVNDATGTLGGWRVTLSATTFTNGPHALPDTGTFSANGSLTSISSPNPPVAACVSTCTLPVNTTTFPVPIATAVAPTAVTIFNAASGSGAGQITFSPIGWWVHVPGNASAGAYVSNLTLAIVSGP